MGESPAFQGVAFREMAAPSGHGRLFVTEGLACDPLPGREIFVWTPDAAETHPRLPVLYLQDGQNLFDSRRVVFGAAWEIDASISRLVDAGLIPPTIVVGIACAADRLAEYAPALILRATDPGARAAVNTAWGAHPSDAYARLVTDRIKPLIDGAFRTLPGPDTTFVAGASMGGVAALELLARRPDLFAGAAALSAHLSLLPVDGSEYRPDGFARDVAAAVGSFARDHLPPAGRHRLWLDRSELDVDRHYGPSHTAMVDALLEKGYRPDVDLVSRTFMGVGHNEAAWRDRLDPALAFLLGGKIQPA